MLPCTAQSVLSHIHGALPPAKPWAASQLVQPTDRQVFRSESTAPLLLCLPHSVWECFDVAPEANFLVKRYSQVFHASRKVGQQVPENDYSRGERLDGSNQVWCPLCRMTYSSSKMPSQMPTQEKLVPQGNPEREANFDVLYCAPTALCWSEPR